ncbi:hypothetical protein G3A56_02530 [Rhizobium oryzihabitans]|uniref:Uncharacterized protein n=1 Tax=Rhizobium oryzihabitans TaxID=2267833 RepID=A0A7L5BDQ5_9HYPH|nr:hypothetical protein [Rhizobium oryzihabitans]QIB37008.1 hypothetical protein G3A56_02530 [Rhizobium oryzihabitans]
MSATDAKHKLLEIADMIITAKNLNRALFMACSDVKDTFAVNALQALSEEIDDRIKVIRDCVEELGEAFA